MKTLSTKTPVLISHISQRFFIVFLVFLFLLPFSFNFMVEAEEDSFDANTIESQVLALLNADRAAEGLPKLQISTDMRPYTQVRAKELTVLFEHRKPDGSSPFADYHTGLMGENIQKNYLCESNESLAASVYQAFKNSPSHWANMMDPDWLYMSMSAYKGVSGAQDYGYIPVYFCQWFSN